VTIKRFTAQGFRCLDNVGFEPDPDYTLVYGANASGKTSLLEAIAYLGRGKSFRGAPPTSLIQHGEQAFVLFAQVESGGRMSGVGVRNSRAGLEVKVDGVSNGGAAALAAALPLQVIDPDVHNLVCGGPDERRRFLDWLVFHVEPGYLALWRQFRRVLKQRNAALRNKRADMLDSLDAVLAQHAETLTLYRKRHCDSLAANIQTMLDELNSGLPVISLGYQRGWSGGDYLEALRLNRARDRERGLTLSGPHRADLSLDCAQAPARAILSRGEQKVLAAALLLTQAELLATSGEKPVLLLDDLASEFDRFHFDSVLQRALAMGGQALVTGTREENLDRPGVVFHVEQGAVREVV